MFKKAVVLAVAAAALAALAIPATASAKWAHTTPPNGVIKDLEANVKITVTGQAKFQGQVGSVECAFISHTQLTANQTTAHAQFEVNNGGKANDEAECSVGGGLVTVGCTDAEQVTIEGGTEALPWHAKAESQTTIAVSTKAIQNHLTGGALCPKTIQLTPGTVHLKAGQNWFKTGELSGNLQAHIVGQASQAVTVAGTGHVEPSGTYGVT